MKVLQLLQKLSTSELNDFIIYLKCPLHNTNQDLILLVQNLPINNINPYKIKLWKSSFISRHNLNENKFRKSCHLLLNSIYEFSIQLELKKSKKLHNYLLYRSNIDRLNANESASLYLKSIEAIDSNLEKTSEDLAFMFLIEKLNSNQYELSEKMRLSLKKISNILENIVEYENTLINLEKKNLDWANVPQIDENNYPLSTFNPIVQINKNILELYQSDILDEQLESILLYLKEYPNIPKHIVKDSIVKCANYLILKLNRGDNSQNENIWRLYKLGLELKAIIPDLILYRNIAYLASKAGQYEWALNFIEEYKSTLPIDQQDSAYSFTKARIYINMQEWVKVLETLRNVEYEDIGYNLNSKLLIIAAYYELDEYEALDSFIKSFRVFLRRRRNIPVTRKNAFYDFTTVVDHLMKAGDRGDAKRLIKAREVLDSNAAIPNKDWLLEKIEEIEAVIKK